MAKVKMVERRRFATTRARSIVYNLVNLIIFGGLLAVILFSASLVKASEDNITTRNQIIEATWRQQVRNSLGDLKIQFMDDASDGIVDPNNRASVQEWAESRLAGRKISGPGGEAFIIEFNSEEIIWDASKKVSSNAKRFLGDDLLLHFDQELAKNVYEEMRRIYTTDSNSNISWDLNGETEFLEWVIIPTDSKGFNDEPYTIDGVRNPDYHAFLLGYKLQYMEIFNPYAELDAHCRDVVNQLVILNYLITVLGIAFVFWFLYRESRHG